MKIVLATNNMDKVREIKAYYTEFEVVALKEICKPFEIEENGISFYENAMIKARAVYDKIKELGDNGFGYDFMFIPSGFDKTVGQLDESIKLEISHRSKGLRLAKPVLRVISRYYS